MKHFNPLLASLKAWTASWPSKAGCSNRGMETAYRESAGRDAYAELSSCSMGAHVRWTPHTLPADADAVAGPELNRAARSQRWIGWSTRWWKAAATARANSEAPAQIVHCAATPG